MKVCDLFLLPNDYNSVIWQTTCVHLRNTYCYPNWLRNPHIWNCKQMFEESQSILTVLVWIIKHSYLIYWVDNLNQSIVNHTLILTECVCLTWVLTNVLMIIAHILSTRFLMLITIQHSPHARITRYHFYVCELCNVFVSSGFYEARHGWGNHSA